MKLPSSLIVLVLALAAPALGATELALDPPATGDLVPGTLRPAPSAIPRTLSVAPSAIPAQPQPTTVEHRPVQVDWALNPRVPLQTTPQTFVPRSREYWMDVTQSELQRGVPLPVSAPGAVIRLNPAAGRYGALRPAQVSLQVGARTLNAAGPGVATADTRALAAAGISAPPGSVMLHLDPTLGSTTPTLRAPAAHGRYVVHVFEPQSHTELSARLAQGNVLAGQAQTVRLNLDAAGTIAPIGSVGGFVMAPDGQTRTLHFTHEADGSVRATVPTGFTDTTGGALWEVHSFTSSVIRGRTVLRDVTTVFASAVPNARLAGDADVQHDARGGLDVRFGVLAENASRYALGATLWATGADGRLHPIGYAQSADWLDAGHGALVLHFDAAVVRRAGFGPPYALRDLRLQDQATMSLLERRADALTFAF